MSLVAALLPEVDHEMTGVRTSLARVPEDRLDWSPHDRSWSLRGLVTHLANIPRWGLLTLTEERLDMDPGSDREEPVTTVAAALGAFDERLAAFRARLAETTDEQLLATWTFAVNGQVVFAMPRVGCIRSFVLNHAVHHRAQLGVYLRLLDVAVPSLYGPSADEGDGPGA